MNRKVGDKVWILNESTPIEVTIRLVGNNEVAYNLDGSLETKSTKEVYSSKEEAETSAKARQMTVFCREVSRTSGEVAVYPINVKIDDGLIQALRIRSRFNPELVYGICMSFFFDTNREKMEDMEELQRMSEMNNVVLL